MGICPVSIPKSPLNFSTASCADRPHSLAVKSMTSPWALQPKQGSVEKICRALDCALDDIVEFMPDDAEGKQYDA